MDKQQNERFENMKALLMKDIDRLKKDIEEVKME
jgi:hypothetical protein